MDRPRGARVGKTFKTTADGGYAGLLSGKKATIFFASMGVYTPESGAQSYNAEVPYLRQILGFMEITDVTFVEVEATWKVDKGVATAEQLLQPHQGEISAAATR